MVMVVAMNADRHSEWLAPGCGHAADRVDGSK